MARGDTSPVMVEVPGIASAAGDAPDLLYASAATELMTPSTIPEVTGLSANGSPASIPALSPVAFQGLTYAPRCRMLLGAMKPSLTASLEAVQVDRVIVLPPVLHATGRRYHASAQLRGLLTRGVPALAHAHWEDADPSASPVAALERASAMLAERAVNAVLIMGVDACAAPSVAAGRSFRRFRRTSADAQGATLADGAGCVLLRRQAEAAAVPVGIQAVLRFCAKEDGTGLPAWAEVTDRALGAAGDDVWDAEVSLAGALPSEQAVWANVRRHRPPLREGSMDRLAAWRGLGFAGAASLPLLFATVIGRLGFPEPPARRVLAVCGGAALPGAGVALLEQPDNG